MPKSSSAEIDGRVALLSVSAKVSVGRRVTIESIVKAVAERFSLEPWQLKRKTNEKKIAYPRQIAMYLAKELTRASVPEIGRAFNGKHHTTVNHSIQKIGQLRQHDVALDSLIHKLMGSLSPALEFPLALKPMPTRVVHEPRLKPAKSLDNAPRNA